MNVRGGELLRQLGAGVRPEGGREAGSARSLDGRDFASLLADVRVGKLSSGRPVTVGAHADVELTEGQLERLGVVADAAEAAGATRVAAMIDGRVVTLDILTRTVESGGEAGGLGVLTGVDAFVVVPEDVGASMASLFGKVGSVGGGERGGEGGLALGLVRNRSVAELLSGLEERVDG